MPEAAFGTYEHEPRNCQAILKYGDGGGPTGDLRGGVRVWNLRERALASTIDDQEGYRLDNAVVGISEEESVGYLALAFSNGRISVFIISDDDSG